MPVLAVQLLYDGRYAYRRPFLGPFHCLDTAVSHETRPLPTL